MNPAFVQFRIEVEGKDEITTINLNHIIQFHAAWKREENQTIVTTVDGKGILVKETYEQVQAILKNYSLGQFDFNGTPKNKGSKGSKTPPRNPKPIPN